MSSSIREVKKDGASEKVACCLLHSLPRSAEYLVSLFNYLRSLGSHKHEVRMYTLTRCCDTQMTPYLISKNPQFKTLNLSC